MFPPQSTLPCWSVQDVVNWAIDQNGDNHAHFVNVLLRAALDGEKIMEITEGGVFNTELMPEIHLLNDPDDILELQRDIMDLAKYYRKREERKKRMKRHPEQRPIMMNLNHEMSLLSLEKVKKGDRMNPCFMQLVQNIQQRRTHLLKVLRCMPAITIDIIVGMCYDIEDATQACLGNPIWYRVCLNTIVRTEECLDSERLRILPMGSRTRAVRLKGRRVEIDLPIAGWCSVTSKSGDLILSPINHHQTSEDIVGPQDLSELTTSHVYWTAANANDLQAKGSHPLKDLVNNPMVEVIMLTNDFGKSLQHLSDVSKIQYNRMASWVLNPQENVYCSNGYQLGTAENWVFTSKYTTSFAPRIMPSIKTLDMSSIITPKGFCGLKTVEFNNINTLRMDLSGFEPGRVITNNFDWGKVKLPDSLKVLVVGEGFNGDLRNTQLAQLSFKNCRFHDFEDMQMPSTVLVLNLINCVLLGGDASQMKLQRVHVSKDSNLVWGRITWPASLEALQVHDSKFCTDMSHTNLRQIHLTNVTGYKHSGHFDAPKSLVSIMHNGIPRPKSRRFWC